MKKKSSELIKQSRERLKKHRAEYKELVSDRLDLFVYWTSLVLLALFNLVAVFFLIPFLMFFADPFISVMVGGIGLLFGFLFNLLIMGIEHMKKRHTITAGFFIPILAILDIMLILSITETINTMLVRPVTYNVSLVVVVFITTFVAPYLYSVVTGKHRL